ncbi:Ig domain-containing protein [Phaeacidiphilus oryzae]|uniref:Ig domain-containing protein n=1 Tax=Phaeacidiphilus oryzae TaxID=348818 RepID=UPI0005618764|nr:Ig domain-containing protein [Phaeacidiphilus oryzae]
MQSFGRSSPWSGARAEGESVPLELRFIDLLMIVIAALLLVAVLLSVVSAHLPAHSGSGAVARPPLRVATAQLPDATAGRSYTLTLAATGGDGTDRWTAAGPLPAGLRLDGSGVLSGTPSAAGGTSFRVTVADGTGASSTRTLALRVAAAPAAATGPRAAPAHHGTGISWWVALLLSLLALRGLYGVYRWIKWMRLPPGTYTVTKR